MKKINTLLLTLVLCTAISGVITAQRYTSEVFTDVSVQRNVVYARNISVLTGAPAAIDLLMDVYTPVGDTETDRPVVIYLHTGSFLPAIINGQVTGSRSDSSVVEICKRLARMGYVSIAATYRQGWNPVATGSTGQNTRTGTLLNAVYRGIQDVRSCIRFLRKEEATNNDPYGIDSDKIVVWGQGTGGYISLAAAYLDRYEEIVLDKFINTETLQPYVVESLSGDVYGLNQTPLNLPNHVGYSSDFKMAINMGGALGDTSWIEGKANEPAVVAYHFLRDPFAPFANGPVIVPTTGDFVVSVSGSRVVVADANNKGSNDILAPVNALNTDPLTLRVRALSQVPITYQGQNITLATDNFYPFITEGTDFRSGLWEWWDKATLNLVVAGTNAALGSNYNADTLHNNGLRTNPNMSKALALTYIDTIIRYFAPRACNALELGCATTSLEILNANSVELRMAPNPASEAVYFQTGNAFPILDLQLFDLSGKLVRSNMNLKDNSYTLHRNGLPPGIYFAKLRFEQGIVTQKLIFN